MLQLEQQHLLARLGALALGDVDDRGDAAVDLAARLLQRRRENQDVELAAVGAQQLAFEAVHRLVRPDHRQAQRVLLGRQLAFALEQPDAAIDQPQPAARLAGGALAQQLRAVAVDAQLLRAVAVPQHHDADRQQVEQRLEICEPLRPHDGGVAQP